MSSKVVDMRGESVPPPGTPVESLIAAVEDLLERCRTGEVQSMIATGVTIDAGVFTVFSNVGKRFYTELGAIEMLKPEYFRFTDVHPYSHSGE